jgi:hypothetical protein
MGTDLIAVGFNNYVPSSFDAAVTRIDHQNANGYGFIATLKFRTSGSLTGTGNTSLLTLTISNPTLISNTYSVIPVNALPDSVVVRDTLLTPTGANITLSAYPIGIFPNPTTGEFLIYNLQYLIGSRIKITNVFGQTIFQTSITGKEESIQMNGVPAGAYFLHVITPYGTSVKKIIKE